MKEVKNHYKLFIVIFLFWVLLNVDFNILSLSFGIIISAVVTRASYNVLYYYRGFKFKLPKLIVLLRYTLRLFIEIYKSSIDLIYCIIKKDCAPVVEQVELDTTDPLIIAIIANSITLTPGTITVDSKGNILRVLSMRDYKDNGETVRREIKEKFEKLLT